MASNFEYESAIDSLDQWFRENTKLPQCIDRLLLKRFYHCMYEDIGETKKLILKNYSLRNKHGHIFLKRDPIDQDTCRTFEYADMIPLAGLTTENYRVSFYRLSDYDPNKVHYTEDIKAFFMASDCRFALPDVPGEATLSSGEVQLFDMSGYTMKHVTKISFSTLRVYVKFLQEAYPVRLRAIHFINCPTYLDKIMSVVRPFISKEVYQMMCFHTHGMDELYKKIPREMLPEEYGGQAGKIEDLKAKFVCVLQSKRDYLMDPKHWKVQ